MQEPFLNTQTIIFLTVVRRRSFSAAAQELGMTQSAVSQAIANLEKLWGMDLFDRSTRPLTVLKEALVLYEELTDKNSTIVSVLHNLQHDNGIRLSLRLGLVESLARSAGPKFIQRLAAEGCKVSVHVATSDVLYQRLLFDELDVIIATGHFQHAANLEQRWLFSEPHIVLLPKSVAQQRALWQWKDLQYCGVPMIRYTNNTATGVQSEILLAQAHLGDIPSQFTVDDNLLMFRLVDAGMGWTLAQPLAWFTSQKVLLNATALPAPEPCAKRELFIAKKKTTPSVLMERVERVSIRCITEDVIPNIIEAMPWTANALEVASLQPKR